MLHVPLEWKETVQRLVELAALDSSQRGRDAEEDVRRMLAALRSGQPEVIDIDRVKMKWCIEESRP